MLSDMLGQGPSEPPRKENATGLLTIEQRLSEDTNGSYRRELLERLQEARTGLRRKLDGGVPPETYRRLITVMEAIDTACTVIAETHPQIHERSYRPQLMMR